MEFKKYEEIWSLIFITLRDSTTPASSLFCLLLLLLFSLGDS